MPVPSFAQPDVAATPLHMVGPGALDALLAQLSPAQQRWVAAQGFNASAGATVALPDADGGLAAALVGQGNGGGGKPRFGLAAAASALPAGTYRLATDLEPAAAEEAALGWLLGSYRFDTYRAGDGNARRLVAPDGVDGARLEAIAAGVFLGRDLINTPACDMGPDALEAAVRTMAEPFDAEVAVTQGDDLLIANLPMIHTVGRAAVQAPRLIDLRWGPADAPKVTVVGKGVCFDTGGLDLKPAAAMRLMKKDMGGAGAAIALARIVMARGLPVRLRLLVPAVENAVAGASFRPGDVLRSRKGLTVEIGNTDAEGRLVLADALTLACEEKPDLLLDFATLTGAARVALGPDLPPLYTDSDALAGALTEAGARVADPLWRMPLWDGYEDDIRGDIADLDNAPGGGMAGSITAALFLRRFVEGAGEWAHMDIYGWTPKAKPARPTGGEPQGARAAFALIEDRYG